MKVYNVYKLFENKIINLTKVCDILIEFDGLQHYKPLGYFGGDKKLEFTQLCDKIKNEYCLKNNIRLIRISYSDIKNINRILSGILI